MKRSEASGDARLDPALDPARAQARGIHDHVNFLGSLDLKNLRDRIAPPGGGLPMDFVVAVAGDVFAEFLKIAALADLPLGVRAEGAPVQKQRGETLPLAEQIGINAEFRSHRHGFAHRPETERARRFPDGIGSEPVIAAARAAVQGQASRDHSALRGQKDGPGLPAARRFPAARARPTRSCLGCCRSLLIRNSDGLAVLLTCLTTAGNSTLDALQTRPGRAWHRARPARQTAMTTAAATENTGRDDAAHQRRTAAPPLPPRTTTLARDDHAARGTRSSRHGDCWRICWMTSATVRPSISNSGRRIRRCSSTGGAIVLMSSGVTKSRPDNGGAGARGHDERLRGARAGADQDALVLARGADDVHEVGDQFVAHDDGGRACRARPPGPRP